MYQTLLIGIGGAFGSILRYLVSGFVQQVLKNADFPFGTIAVNLLGCFIIGLLSELAETRGLFTAESRALVFVGFLGGFTTFSTFSNETMNLVRDGEGIPALVNVGVQVVLGLSAVWLGRTAAEIIWR